MRRGPRLPSGFSSQSSFEQRPEQHDPCDECELAMSELNRDSM